MLVLLKFLFPQINDMESRSMKILRHLCEQTLYRDCRALGESPAGTGPHSTAWGSAELSPSILGPSVGGRASPSLLYPPLYPHPSRYSFTHLSTDSINTNWALPTCLVLYWWVDIDKDSLLTQTLARLLWGLNWASILAYEALNRHWHSF